jgi:hypothetical protein
LVGQIFEARCGMKSMPSRWHRPHTDRRPPARSR